MTGYNFKKKDSGLNLIKEMKEVRDVVTLGLQARQKEEIPVRQPLNSLNLTGYELKEEYYEIIKDELNIKEIKFISGETKSVEIDTYITEELRTEGQYRELVRAIQDMRKKSGLSPSDQITLEVSVGVRGEELINTFKTELLKAVGSKDIKIKENEGTEVKIDDLVFIVNLVK